MKSFLYKFLILSTFLLSFSISYTQAESIQGPFSKKYVQCFASENTAFFGEKYKDTCGPIGWASYHFVNESEVYINWWEFDASYEDGSKARTKYFENISFDDVSRTFRGMLIFDKTIPDFGSPKKFDYEMIFNEDYSMIHNGKIKITDQDGNIAEQNYNYRNLIYCFNRFKQAEINVKNERKKLEEIKEALRNTEKANNNAKQIFEQLKQQIESEQSENSSPEPIQYDSPIEPTLDKWINPSI